MTIDQFREIRNKAGGLIVMLPKSLVDLTAEEKEVKIAKFRMKLKNADWISL